MKKLVAAGTTLIVSHPPLGYGNRHDTWPSHSTMFKGYYGSPTGAGGICCWFWFILKDGSDFVYPTALFGTSAEFYAFYDLSSTFITPDGFIGFFGETYNFVYRPLAFAKMPFADFGAWLAAR